MAPRDPIYSIPIPTRPQNLSPISPPSLSAVDSTRQPRHRHRHHHHHTSSSSPPQHRRCPTTTEPPRRCVRFTVDRTTRVHFGYKETPQGCLFWSVGQPRTRVRLAVSATHKGAFVLWFSPARPSKGVVGLVFASRNGAFGCDTNTKGDVWVGLWFAPAKGALAPVVLGSEDTGNGSTYFYFTAAGVLGGDTGIGSIYSLNTAGCIIVEGTPVMGNNKSYVTAS
ncbi:hypothetical protein Tco_1302543 [Tanacetum coccineum]